MIDSMSAFFHLGRYADNRSKTKSVKTVAVLKQLVNQHHLILFATKGIIIHGHCLLALFFN